MVLGVVTLDQCKSVSRAFVSDGQLGYRWPHGGPPHPGASYVPLDGEALAAAHERIGETARNVGDALEDEPP